MLKTEKLTDDDVFNKVIILFDDHCLICNRAVQFIIKFAINRNYRFASLSSDVANQILLQQNINNFEFDSIVVYTKGRILYKSQAFWSIARYLPICYPFFIFRIIPRKFQNIVYDYIAKNRYQWFPPLKSCQVITQKNKTLFLK